MRKLLSMGILGVLLVLFSTNGIFAHSGKYSPPDNFLTFSCFVQPLSLGYKYRVHDRVYAAANLDYCKAEEDLTFRAGAEYLFPRKIIIFRLYGGGGLQVSRNSGYQYPYISIGTNFIFLFTEIIYPLKSRIGPEYRAGFSFKF